MLVSFLFFALFRHGEPLQVVHQELDSVPLGGPWETIDAGWHAFVDNIQTLASQVASDRGSIDNDVFNSSMVHDVLTDDSQWLANETETLCKHPHIILIVADDLGHGGVGYNNAEVKTPHIDSLAATGAILDSFYAAPVCGPSRFSLLTGRDPWKSEGASNNLAPELPVGTDLGYSMLPAVLKTVGYATHLVGKWHQGFHRPEYTPTYRGFDTFYGILEGASDHVLQSSTDFFCNGRRFTDIMEDNQPAKGVDYAGSNILGDTRYRERVVDIITKHDAKIPLFIYAALQYPHQPFQISADLSGRYKFGEEKNTYYGMLSHLDESVGAIVNALKDSDLYGTSLVVFMSDNGAPPEAPAEANHPLTGFKGNVFEGGIHVPAFVTGGMLPAAARHTRIADLFSISDWYATLANLANAVPDTAGPAAMDSLDQWGLLTGESQSPRRSILQMHAAARLVADSSGKCRKSPPAWSLIADGFKLMKSGDGGKFGCGDKPCLFHLANDQSETNDVAAQNPQVVADMQSAVDKRLFEASKLPAFARIFNHQKTLQDFQNQACAAFSAAGDWIVPWASDVHESLYLSGSDHCTGGLFG